MQKRILIISYHTCPLASEEGKETGGMNVYVLELARQLGSIGYRVDVITRSQDINNRQIVPVSENFRVIHLTAGPQAPVNKKKLPEYMPEFIDAFFAFMESENVTYDIIDAHYYQSGLIAMDINRRLPEPLPLVMTFHTLALMKNLVARSASEQEGRYRIDAELLLTRAADAIITPSHSDKQYLSYLYDAPPVKIHEIPPGVNTELFRPIPKQTARMHLNMNQDTKNILFVGRIEPLKGIDMLLYALKILIARHPGIPLSLSIVGGDVSQHITRWSTPLRQLEQLRHTLRISANVNFIGQRPQHELPYYYNAAEVVVMPSHYESFGMAAAEAMACGVPVITTNVTGISSLLDDRRSSLVTSVNNPLLLASQIAEILTDPGVYDHIRSDIMQSIQDRRWNIVANRISGIYESLLTPQVTEIRHL